MTQNLLNLKKIIDFFTKKNFLLKNFKEMKNFQFLIQLILINRFIFLLKSNGICPLKNHLICNINFADRQCVCAMSLNEVIFLIFLRFFKIFYGFFQERRGSNTKSHYPIGLIKYIQYLQICCY